MRSWDVDRRRVLQGVACAPLMIRPAQASQDKWRALAADVRAQMSWAWHSYVERCFGQDQIKPGSGPSETLLARRRSHLTTIRSPNPVVSASKRAEVADAGSLRRSLRGVECVPEPRT